MLVPADSARSEEDLPDASRHFRDGAGPEIRPTNLARNLEDHLAIDEDPDDDDHGGRVEDLPGELPALRDAGGLDEVVSVPRAQLKVRTLVFPLVGGGSANAGLVEATAIASTTPRNIRFIWLSLR